MPITGTELSTISTDTSAGSGDHGKIVLLSSNGKISGTMLIGVIPAGGTTGQVLAKNSGTDYDVSWTTGGGGSGTITGVTAGTGLSGGGTSGTVSLAVSYGTASGTAAQGDDSRLSDDRTASGLRTATTVVSVSGSAAPVNGSVLIASGASSATWKTFDDGAGGLGLTIYKVTADTLSGGVPGSVAFIGPENGSSGAVWLRTASSWQFLMAFYEPIGTIKVNGSNLAASGSTTLHSHELNLIAGSGVTLTTGTDLSGVRNTLTIAATGGGGGTITGVTAGTGLTGGGTSGTVTVSASLASTAPGAVSAAAGGAGTGTTIARVDHSHQASVGTPSALTVGGSNSAGSSDNLVRADHTHALPAFGTSAGTFAEGNDSRLSDTRDPTIHTQTLKTTPVSADELVIADSAASFGLKRITIASLPTGVAPAVTSVQKVGTAIGTRGSINLIEGSNVTITASDNPGSDRVDITIASSGGGGGGSGYSNVYLAAPTSPGSLDDEFTSGSSDLATRGWTVTNDSGTTMTRVGDVTLTYPSTLTSTQYRSTLTGSGMLIQSVSKMNVSKAVTGSWAFSCDMRANHQSTDGVYFYEAPMIWDVFPPKLDNTMRRVYVGNFSANRFGSQMNTPQAYTTVIANISSVHPSSPWYAWLDWESAGKNWRGLFGDPLTERIISPTMTTNNFSTFTMAAAGFGLQTARSSSNSWICIRHFRQLTQGTFPGVP